MSSASVNLTNSLPHKSSIQSQELTKGEKYASRCVGGLVGAVGICATVAVTADVSLRAAFACATIGSSNNILCSSSGFPFIPLLLFTGGLIISTSLADSSRRVTETSLKWLNKSQTPSKTKDVVVGTPELSSLSPKVESGN